MFHAVRCDEGQHTNQLRWERQNLKEAYTMFGESRITLSVPETYKIQNTAHWQGWSLSLVTQTPIPGGLPRLGIAGMYSLVYLWPLLDTFRYLYDPFQPKSF